MKDIEQAAPPLMMRPLPHEPWFPVVIPIIFIGNVAMFVYSMYVNNCPAATGVGAAERCVLYSHLGRFSFQPLSENPLLGPSAITLHRLGALELKEVLNGEGWRLLTCMWLHLGAIHLLANMLSLLFIGIRLEQDFGFLKIGALYVLAGLGGSLASAIRQSGSQQSLSVGASGAIFGLLGAMVSELMVNWSIYENKFSTLATLVVVVIVNLAVGFLPHIDGSAHFGGFIAGFLLGFVLLMRPQFGYISHKYAPPGYGYGYNSKPKHSWCQYSLWVAAFIFLLIGFASGFGVVFSEKLRTGLDFPEFL